MKKNKWIDIAIVIVMIICLNIAIQYYFNLTNDSCMNNPLVYAAEKYEEESGYPFQGSGSFIRQGKSPIIYFSSDGLDVVE